MSTRRRARRDGKTGGGDTPTFAAQRAAAIREIPPHPAQEAMFLNAANSYLRVYRVGGCSAIVTREFGDWHLSIAHPTRMPTWMEISGAWYRLIPDAGRLTGALVLPPLHEYINRHEFCMQVVQIPDRKDIPE